MILLLVFLLQLSDSAVPESKVIDAIAEACLKQSFQRNGVFLGKQVEEVVPICFDAQVDDRPWLVERMLMLVKLTHKSDAQWVIMSAWRSPYLKDESHWRVEVNSGSDFSGNPLPTEWEILKGEPNQGQLSAFIKSSFELKPSSPSSKWLAHEIFDVQVMRKFGFKMGIEYLD